MSRGGGADARAINCVPTSRPGYVWVARLRILSGSPYQGGGGTADPYTYGSVIRGPLPSTARARRTWIVGGKVGGVAVSDIEVLGKYSRQRPNYCY